MLAQSAYLPYNGNTGNPRSACVRGADLERDDHGRRREPDSRFRQLLARTAPRAPVDSARGGGAERRVQQLPEPGRAWAHSPALAPCFAEAGRGVRSDV